MTEATRFTPETTARTVVITGGQGALGTALANTFAREGWVVHAPGHAELDVEDPDCIRSWFKQLGRCDVLVHNAGILRDHVLARMSEDDWDRVLDTHLKGAAMCAQAVLPLMLRLGGGTILNIASHSAISGPVGQSNYAAAKAALIGLTRSLAIEYGGKNIRANVLLPGFMETPMTARVPDEVRERIRSAHLLRRFTTPEESARFIAFLATCESISGQVFALDSRPVDWG